MREDVARRYVRVRAAAIRCCAVLVGAVVLAQAPQPVLEIVSPVADGFISGPVVLRVRLDPPPAGPVRMQIYADGKLVCTLDRPPWECAWDAGVGVTEHQIRAVAMLAGGRRLVHTVRTKGVSYTEQTDVDAVQVTVSVTDEAGEYVGGLKRQQFRVSEDGSPQTVDYFGAGETVPLELIAAVDVSGSMADSMGELKRSVKAFLGALRPQDKVTLIAFNDNIFTLARASMDPGARVKAVDRLAPWGGTSLYDVTVRASDMLGRQRGRRALVIFTDGEDTASRTTLPFVERRLERSDAVIYTIGQGRGTHVERLKQILARLARKSGGRAFFHDNIEQLSGAFNDILTELGNQYLLTYTPPVAHRDGAWHKIKVTVTDNRYSVRAREGYRAPGKS
jgi:Ca-activated chloride channel family protein